MSTQKDAVDEIFAQYLRELREFAVAEKTEHTDRGALEKLLKAFAAQAPGRPKVQHEPKRVADKGAPDFKVIQSGMILGYVENKAIGENLTKVLKSEQIKRYETLSDNIILTDYLEWIWIHNGERKAATLCLETDLENRRFKLNAPQVDAVAELLAGFFSTAPEGIGTSRPLAEALAARSKLLRDYLTEELIRQDREHQEGRLFGLFKTFRDQVFHELTLREFADAFAQMLAYGLFLARLNADDKTAITLGNARDHIPGSFRLIHELVEFLIELNKTEYREIRWVVEEVLSLVNGLDLDAIREDLSFRQRRAINRAVRAQDEEEHRLFERDPFIYFYEDYLNAYDKETRKGRGVYYTPPPVVNFIVRALDDILKDSFGIKSGLADNTRVTVLDFACGTGTFLLETFQQIFENIGGADSAVAKNVVSEHILKNLYGFEYLIAPYTIAHLKLSQYLRDKGHPLKDRERLQVFLTNTLEPIHPEPNFLLPAITQEAEAAQKIKERPILVITGNPPYSGHSRNKGKWIAAAIDGYKYTVEKNAEGREFQKPLGERNPKWLNDDYVKFIRFAQLKMDDVEEGVVGIITNHSWLDNPTFRGMRQSLMRSFEQIYVLDLHGNSKKKEKAPDGTKDENVFDIEQGVAISVFVKRRGVERGIWRGDIWGKRLEKYKFAAEQRFRRFSWVPLEPTSPFYLFAQQDGALRAEYETGWPLTEIFPVNVLGFQTHRDDFAVSFTKDEMKGKLRELANAAISDGELHRRYGLSSNRDWSLAEARIAARNGQATEPQLVSYRPFDNRWSEFGKLTMDFPRRELLDHVAGKRNLVLGVGRFGNAIPERPWELVTASAFPMDANMFRRGGVNLFPLWLGSAPRENLSAKFRTFVDARYRHPYAPEEIFGYIYALLHAPTYRTRYAAFLRIDFPRIPFPEKSDDFEMSCELGWELVQAHLLKEYPDAGLAKYHGKGDDTVDSVRYSQAEQAISINKTQCFRPVPQDVWDIHIGGYRVLEKYLKSRKGRQLSLDEINHVAAVADSLAFTIAQMARIDDAYKKAFPDRG